MKVNCIFCDKKISKAVFQAMTRNEIGRIQCPHCKKENKRYISEFDLLYCFLFNTILYGLMIILFIFVTTLNSEVLNQNFFIVYFAMLAITLIICYYFTKTNNLHQYKNPAYKKSWMNQTLNENAVEVNSRMNFNLMMFIVISVVIGTQAEWFYLFIFMYIAFISITGIKTHLLYKKEFTSLPKKRVNN